MPFRVSWYNKEGYLRTDLCYTKHEVDSMERTVLTMGGTDFQRGVAGTKRPKVKEAEE